MTSTFRHQYRTLCAEMLDAPVIRTGRWQSIDVSSPLMATHEILDETLRFHIPDTIDQLQDDLSPYVNLPWAEEHFSERVGGVPLNPPPSNERWPWARHNKRFQDEGDAQKPFSHSYPERMWPRYTGGYDITGLDGDFITEDGKTYRASRDGRPIGNPINFSGFPRVERMGVRFRYGDLQDVVNLLVREPLTRQAYLPIWFPEDTGVVHGERVPCTLGYHFMTRHGQMSCRYYMRSCDLIRHFSDDVYMAARLTQWVVDAVNRRVVDAIRPSHLLMHVTSLHAFVGDEYKMKQSANE